MYRTDIYDFAPGFGRHLVLDESLSDEEEPLEIHIHYGVEVGLGDIPEIGAPFQSCIVDENIDPGELCRRIRDKFLAIQNTADVVLKARTSAAQALNRRDDFIRPSFV